jgi:hypothetical protein
MLDSDFHETFIDNYSSNSFKQADEISSQKKNKHKRNVY